MPDWDHIFRLVVAVALGGAIGLERELRDKPAGFRTIMLICLGACVFTLISGLVGSGEQQSTRIAAQIVTGIGFLGAGAIIRDRQSVIGMTTAATIWAMAAVGMACGFGLLGLATLGTVLILLALTLFDAVERYIGTRWDMQEYRIETRKAPDAPERLTTLFDDHRLRLTKRRWFESNGTLIADLTAVGREADHERLRFALIKSEDFFLRDSL